MFSVQCKLAADSRLAAVSLTIDYARRLYWLRFESIISCLRRHNGRSEFARLWETDRAAQFLGARCVTANRRQRSDGRVRMPHCQSETGAPDWQRALASCALGELGAIFSACLSLSLAGWLSSERCRSWLAREVGQGGWRSRGKGSGNLIKSLQRATGEQRERERQRGDAVCWGRRQPGKTSLSRSLSLPIPPSPLPFASAPTSALATADGCATSDTLPTRAAAFSSMRKF